MSAHQPALQMKNYATVAEADEARRRDSAFNAIADQHPDWCGVDLHEPPPLLPQDNASRKQIPILTGVLDYFPSALLEVAKVSFIGNEQHNPGEPLHWARGKSMEQGDTMLRHYMQRGTKDSDNVRHLAKAAWRVLAALQLEMEAAGYPVARGAKQPE